MHLILVDDICEPVALLLWISPVSVTAVNPSALFKIGETIFHVGAKAEGIVIPLKLVKVAGNEEVTLISNTAMLSLYLRLNPVDRGFVFHPVTLHCFDVLFADYMMLYSFPDRKTLITIVNS